MAELPINYGDTGKVARDKINESFNALEATVAGYRPHIESGIRWIGDTNTGVKAEGDSIVMKAEDGYIWYKSESNSWTKIIAIADLKGEQGEPGDDGNGIASITATKIGKTTTVTITETDGNVDTFDILDGADGAGGGDVKGPESATSGNIVIFDGTTGKKVKDGGALGTAATKDTGTSSGNIPVLDSNGKLATSTIPGVALTDTFTVSTSSDLTSLSSAEQGDIAIATSENKTYVLSQAPYSTAANWKEILAPTGGVTSVNGQTGAVTIEVPNTKTFYLSSTSDLTTAQSAYDWYADGKNPIVVLSNTAYMIKYVDIEKLRFGPTSFHSNLISNSTTSVTQDILDINFSAGVVSSITTSNSGLTGNFLRTDYNYSSPYTPAYNGSPATKKYVDDKITTSPTAPSSPTEGMLWYDTTSDAMKVWDGTAWQSVGGGDVLVSDQANNIFTPGMKIWGGTESDYQSLTPDSNTAYLLLADQPTPPPTPSWQGDMSNRALAQTSSGLSGTWWGGISMNLDGTKLYLSQGTNMMEYSLGTAYDISSIPSPTYTLPIGNAIEDLCFSPDGTKLYIVYGDGVSIRKYDLSTAWDLSTAVYNNQELNTPSPSRTRGLYVTPDGTKIFISSHQSYSKSWMCTLSTAWDLSTASTWTQTLSNSGVSCCFGDDGKLYFTQINESTSDLTYMTLSTAYDLSTVTSTDTKNIGAMRAGGIWFKADGTICMMVGGGSSTNYVTKYTL